MRHRTPALVASDLLEACNRHDLERFVACYAPDYEGVDIGESGRQVGPAIAQQAMGRYLRAFPDLQLTCDQLVSQGPRVVLFWTMKGTQRGPIMNIPPTGRRVMVQGVSLLQIEAGLVHRALHLWDVAGLLRALGLLPDLPLVEGRNPHPSGSSEGGRFVFQR